MLCRKWAVCDSRKAPPDHRRDLRGGGGGPGQGHAALREGCGLLRGGGVQLLSQQVPSTHGETGSNPSFLPMHLLEIRYWQVSQLDWFRT